MAVGFSATVKGDAELIAKLKMLRGSKLKSILRKTTRKGARRIWSAVKSAAPVGPTGNYKRGIKMKTKVLKDGNVATWVRGTARHSTLLEKGTKERVQKSTGRATGRGPALKIMADAARSVGQAAMDVVIVETGKEIERLATSGA